MNQVRSHDAVIFDLGGVVTSYDPMGFALRIVGEATRAAHVKRLVFGTRAWLALDQGLATEAETEARLVAENPDDAADIHKVFALYKDLLVPIPEGVDVVKQVRKGGTRVYALSNFGPGAWEVVRQRDMYLELFDGIVISCQEKILKPDPAIFEILLERYGLEPKRCVFIDDVPANVETARRLGIDGIHFENHRQLRQCLATRGIVAWEEGRSRAS